MEDKITSEQIESFLNGRDPMKRIISIECDYNSDIVNVIFINDKGEKRIAREPFKPFAWVKLDICKMMFNGDRAKLKNYLLTYGIGIKKLITEIDGSGQQDRLESGYKFLFYATRKMSNQTFSQFFTMAGTPVRGAKDAKDITSTKGILMVSPVEQYMISSGKRLFKGYDSYDQLKRLIFDIETEGLNPIIHAIEQIGVRTNKGFEKIIRVDKEDPNGEMNAILEFVKIIGTEKPDIIAGHNSENFDWDFIIQRCELHGIDFAEMTKEILKNPIYKKKNEVVLKLGGETEYYRPTILWGHIILDSLHAVRRAQAIDSNMERANLKYVTKYLNLNKGNRVYVKGGQITNIWNEKNSIFAFNDSNGDWYRITEERPIEEGYEPKSGEYIVERYLLDDLWETDKVELALNESNFLVGKLLPTNFSRACTMGTAGIWKLIMLAWCYENNLGVPAFTARKRFTGGLSRLLKTGYVPNIVKLDYNSLYPSIVLTWNVSTPVDIMHAMVHMLEYVLSQRELYKGLKAEAGAKAKKYKGELEKHKDNAETYKKIIEEINHWKSEKSSNDKKQLPLKIFANSFFGSYGAPNIFPFGDVLAAEKVTCIGRMSLRLMISHFSNIGYEPIVGDSFTGDTPLFIKYDDNGMLDIKPIEELIGKTETDALGREYDITEKPYKVLCRSGWVKPDYIYRHETSKPLYNISDGDVNLTVTEDHSLFNDSQEKIKPSKIKEGTRLEYYTGRVREIGNENKLDGKQVVTMAMMLKNNSIDKIPIEILNASVDDMKLFLNSINGIDTERLSKTCLAGIMFLNNAINEKV